jgi:hypothetical protein
MTVILWAQLLLGIATVAVSLAGRLDPRRLFVPFGSVNAVTAAAILVWQSGSDWGGYVMVGFVIFLVAILFFLPRGGWREARSVVLLAICTIVGLSALQFYYDDISAVSRKFLLIVTTLVAATFVGMMLVTAVRIGRTRRDSSERSQATENI